MNLLRFDSRMPAVFRPFCRERGIGCASRFWHQEKHVIPNERSERGISLGFRSLASSARRDSSLALGMTVVYGLPGISVTPDASVLRTSATDCTLSKKGDAAGPAPYRAHGGNKQDAMAAPMAAMAPVILRAEPPPRTLSSSRRRSLSASAGWPRGRRPRRSH
jgi:hypothetical protein